MLLDKKNQSQNQLSQEVKVDTNECEEKLNDKLKAKFQEMNSKTQKRLNLLNLIFNFVFMSLFIVFATFSLMKKWGDTVLIKVIYVFLAIYMVVFICVFVSMFFGGKSAKENSLAIKNMKAVMKVFKKVLVVLNLVIAMLIAFEGFDGTLFEKIISLTISSFTLVFTLFMIVLQIVKMNKRRKKMKKIQQENQLKTQK